MTPRLLKNILTGLGLVFALTLIVYAGSITEIIPAHSHHPSEAPDTVLYSSKQEIIHKDTTYNWLWWMNGTCNAALKIVSYFRGIPGDTLTLDSTSTTSGTQRVVSTVTGDSIMDMAWKQWTAYSANAREWYKQKRDNFRYRLFIVIYTGGTDSCDVGAEQYTY